jgi:hypothetical protein
MIDARMFHFACLDPPAQADAIRRLRLAGHGAQTISSATGLSAEQVRRVIRDTPIFEAIHDAVASPINQPNQHRSIP